LKYNILNFIVEWYVQKEIVFFHKPYFHNPETGGKCMDSWKRFGITIQ